MKETSQNTTPAVIRVAIVEDNLDARDLFRNRTAGLVCVGTTAQSRACRITARWRFHPLL